MRILTIITVCVFTLTLFIIPVDGNDLKKPKEKENKTSVEIDSEDLKQTKNEVELELEINDNGHIALIPEKTNESMGYTEGKINGIPWIKYEEPSRDLFIAGDFIDSEGYWENGTFSLPLDEVKKYFSLDVDENGNFINKKISEDKYYCLDEITSEVVLERLKGPNQPIKNALITELPTQIPGAPRVYRNGFHEGFDWYSGAIGLEINRDTEVYPIYSGKVVRIDKEYKEMEFNEREKMLSETSTLGRTPQKMLDILRGRQVWIESELGVLVRYAHLDSVNDKLNVGDRVNKHTVLGKTGNSGTSDGALGNDNGIHLHSDILVCGKNFWEYGDKNETVKMLIDLYKKELYGENYRENQNNVDNIKELDVESN